MCPPSPAAFTYIPAEHDTTIVTATEYASCAMSVTAKKYTSGTDVVTLTKPGTYYFYCGVMGHCEMGMKMKVTVGAAAVTPIVAPALPPAAVPVKAPAPAPVPVTAAPVPSPELAPVPSPELAPAPVLGVPDVAPTPEVTDVFVPVAAPAPEASSASSLGVPGFRLLVAGVGFAAALHFMF